MVTEGYGGTLPRYPRCAATQPEKHQVLSKGRHILSDGGCFLMTFRFQVCFEPEEDGGYHAYVPALPGCHSYGRTIEEAERNIKEAILLYLDGLKKNMVCPFRHYKIRGVNLTVEEFNCLDP
jgi:predicted RNase H-like HicB family nuclease